MTNLELAKFRGEFYGLKMLVLNCVSEIASHMPDPNAYLDKLQRETVVGIARAEPSEIQKADIEAFRAAAAGIIAQATGAIEVVHSPTPPRGEIQ